MSDISRGVLTQWRDALAHGTTGFNARCATLAASYGVAPITLDFSFPSKSFTFANVDPVNLFDNKACKAPLMVMYAPRFRNQQETNRARFEGTVQAVSDLIYDFKADTIFGDMEAPGQLIEDVMTSILYEASWTPPVYQVADYSGQRFSLEPGGKNWVSRIRFEVSFRVWY